MLSFAEDTSKFWIELSSPSKGGISGFIDDKRSTLRLNFINGSIISYKGSIKIPNIAAETQRMFIYTFCALMNPVIKRALPQSLDDNFKRTIHKCNSDSLNFRRKCICSAFRPKLSYPAA
jgi:hypothetical protein